MYLSIVICTYNSEKTILRCLQSLKCDMMESIEVILKDGFSTDSTNQIVREFIKKNPSMNIKHIIGADQGIYHAINIGLKSASGKYVMLLHSDDEVVSNNALNQLVGLMSYETSDIMLFPIIVRGKKNTEFKYRVSKFYRLMLNFGHMPPHPGMIVKRDVFQRDNYYSTGYRIASDFDWCLKNLLMSNSCSVKVVHEFCFYRMYAGGISSNGFMSFAAINKEMAHIYMSNGFKFVHIRVLSRIIPKLWLRTFKSKV